ncbi:hypothetical protein [Pontibacter pudoricolor]|uniref:hypothetical protein n=1 Tax=Pontibacter pudoricolor TaxID=2694930 RepID=UPI001391A241|nr:hypothetical protein [Pontibacter pudoricolor]
MKTILLGLLLSFTALNAAAQSDSSAHLSEFRVYFGGAFPKGDFQSSDFEDIYTPFAMLGPLMQVSYAKAVSKNLYGGATIGLRRNAMDLDKFSDDNDELVLNKKSTPWQSIFTLADVEYRFYMPDGYLFVKGSAGAAFNRSASLHVETTYGTIEQAANKHTAFAYGVSTGLVLQLNKFGLGLETGILSTRPEFKFTDQQGKTTNYSLPMTTINLGIFGAFRF